MHLLSKVLVVFKKNIFFHALYLPFNFKDSYFMHASALASIRVFLWLNSASSSRAVASKFFLGGQYDTKAINWSVTYH